MKKLKILVITQFGMVGGASRVQVLQFVPYLRETGFVCVVRHMYPDVFWFTEMKSRKMNTIAKAASFVFFLALGMLKKIWYALTCWRYDVVIIQKETFPESLYWLITVGNPRVIYELEDTLFEVNPFLKTGSVKRILLEYQAMLCKNMMKRAAWVIAENEYIGGEASKHNAHVLFITAPIDVKAYFPRSEQKTTGEKIVIGWIGSGSTTYLLEMLKPMFAKLGAKEKTVVLKTVGTRADFSVGGIEHIKKEWRLEDELSDLQSFDIGLMPLDDSPFNRGRLGYKMIQYMAVGIPVVADDIGLNRTVITNGENGFLVSGKDDWVEKLSMLIHDHELRRMLGARGRAIAEERFAIEKQAKVWVDVVTRVAAFRG